MQPLVQMASYIKVDFQQSDAAARRSIRRMARHSRAAFLAEKVEDEAGMKHAIAEGFEYFQGYFFCRPKIVANREIPPNRMHYLRLLIELTKTPLNLCDVTRIVEMEPSLCYRLLRLANSALHGSRQNIASVSDAFLLVGEDRFRTLVSVAASCLWGEGQSPALIRLALERARFCELAAPLARENPTEQFMLGLMSLVDAMLEMPMETITKSLPLRAEAREALLGASSATAQPLRWIRGFESGGWKHDGGALQETLTGLYLQAVRWVSESLAESL
jgi:EAL and modified HD-GYP domain-containing signal transduction protein